MDTFVSELSSTRIICSGPESLSSSLSTYLKRKRQTKHGVSSKLYRECSHQIIYKVPCPMNTSFRGGPGTRTRPFTEAPGPEIILPQWHWIRNMFFHGGPRSGTHPPEVALGLKHVLPRWPWRSPVSNLILDPGLQNCEKYTSSV